MAMTDALRGGHRYLAGDCNTSPITSSSFPSLPVPLQYLAHLARLQVHVKKFIEVLLRWPFGVVLMFFLWLIS